MTIQEGRRPLADELPDEQPEMRVIGHSSGQDGYALFEHRNDQYGLTQMSRRVNKMSRWTDIWIADRLPTHSFPSYEALLESIKCKAKPKIRNPAAT